MDPVFVRPKEAARLLSVSMPKVNRMIKSGELPSRLSVGSRLIPVAAIRKMAEYEETP